MKKSIFMFLGMIMCMMFLMSESSCESVQDRTQNKQLQNTADAMNQVEIPTMTYFQERKTIAAWAKRWDKAQITTYVYLVSYGTIIGYYVCNGKPASTKSYLLPETRFSTGGTLIESPDIDGTYGDNNPGIRFFTADGVAVEWGGYGQGYLFSDAPLPINVPKLNVVIVNKK